MNLSAGQATFLLRILVKFLLELKLVLGTSGAFTAYYDNIKASWLYTPPSAPSITTYDARDAPDDSFYPGASIHVHAAQYPKITDGDFYIDGDFVIRAIKFLNNERAILYLGYAEATATSPDVMMENILLRHDYNSTS